MNKIRYWLKVAMPIAFVIAMAAIGLSRYLAQSPTLPTVQTANPTNPADLNSFAQDPSRFVAGANYPWHNYGEDFGSSPWGHGGVSAPSNQEAVESDFSLFQKNHITVIRWFVFCDGRTGVVYNHDGSVRSLDDYFFQDMDAAIAIAKRHKVRLILVLIDYTFFDKAKWSGGVQTGGRSAIATDSRLRQSFINNALTPMFEKYGSEQTIAAWEVMNEPEWAMNIQISRLAGIIVGSRISTKDMKTFMGSMIACAHSHAKQPVTIGAAMRLTIGYWKWIGLDFYEFHYYPYMETQTPYDVAVSQLLLDKPVLIGEFPLENGLVSTSEYLDAARRNHYAGAFGWSIRGQDRYSTVNGTRDMGNWIRSRSSLFSLPPRSSQHVEIKSKQEAPPSGIEWKDK